MRFVRFVAAGLQTVLAQRLGTGEEAYAFFYPLVIANVTVSTKLNKETACGYNCIEHARALRNASTQEVVKPNADTLYSGLYYDLPGDAALQLDVPDTAGRYYVWQFMDMWTNTFVSLGSRTTGTRAGNFWLVGPNFSGPVNASVRVSPTRNGWTILRVLCYGAEDLPATHAVQDGFRATYFPGSSVSEQLLAHRSSPGLSPQDAKVHPEDLVASMSSRQFLEYACAVMAAGNLPAAADHPLVSRLARFGIVPGEPFQWEVLPPRKRLALRFDETSMRDFLKVAAGIGPQLLSHKSQWSSLRADVGNYSTDYATRFIIARLGLGANVREDGLYLSSGLDSHGKGLTGKHRYKLTFASGQMPPTRAFWSVTVYNKDSLFVPNPINRYALGDRSGLKIDSDGSCTIYLQPEPPAESLMGNWLPTPMNEPFTLMLRNYWPKEEALTGDWPTPTVVQDSSVSIV